MSWEPYQPALCDLKATNEQEDTHSMNVFIFGSSFTAGSSTKIQCCSEYFGDQSKCIDFHPGGDNWYCAWPGFFLRWLAQEFPHVNINGDNFGRSGYSSMIVANTLTHDLSNLNITQRDIIFLDLSITDTNAIQQGQLYETTEAMESIIRMLCQMSKDGLPTIILLDQWPHIHHREPGPKPINLLSRSSASSIYYNISRHYNLPLWSSKQVLWSEFAATHQSHIAKWLLQYSTHPDFAYHLFFADLLALGFTKSLSTCGKLQYRSYNDLPAPYISVHSMDAVCDPLKRPRLDAFPNSTFVPEDLADFESKLTGWTEFVDHHNVPGFIINNFALDRELSFPVDYSELMELEGEIIKVMYLKTYHNAGMFQLSLCGETIKGTIDTYHHHHMSIPAVYTVLLDMRSNMRACKKAPISKRSLGIIYTPHHTGVNYGNPRVHEKVKILSVQICSRIHAQ